MKKLLTITILIFFLSNCFQDEYDILRLENNPEESNLEYYPDIKSDRIIIKGNSFEILKNNATIFYKSYWLKKGNVYSSKVVKEKVGAIINNTYADLEIKQISNKIVIITRTITGFSSDDLVRVEDIWYFSEEKWKPVLNHSNNFYKVKLLFLNDDDSIDIIIQGGCCDYVKYSVFLGEAKNGFKHIQDIVMSGNIKVEFKNRCNNRIRVDHFDNFKIFSTKSIYFNCEKNMFIFN